MTKLTKETEDVVRKLRRGPIWSTGEPIGSVVGYVNGVLMDEAADLIQSLSDRIDVLEEALGNCFDIACDYTSDERTARSEIANLARASLIKEGGR